MHIRIGTRKSLLAIAQAKEVGDLLEKRGYSYEIITILTTGDKIKDKNLYEIGGKALFLKEIEEALLQKQIDIAVHSFKDVPAQIPDKLKIAGVLERKIANDALLTFQSNDIAGLPFGAKVGTSSVRRKAILLNIRPDLEIVCCRGNVTSRIEQLMQQRYDAIILAASGLMRLNILNCDYCHIIEHKQMLPAVCQGIIALEVRCDDVAIIEICKAINHPLTWSLAKAERGFLETMNADCQTPIAALAEIIDDNKVQGQFLLAEQNGSAIYSHAQVFEIANGYEVGSQAAQIVVNASLNKKIN